MPANPLVLTADERDTIVDSLSTLAIEPDYIAYGVTPHLVWDFHWVAPAETLANASREDLGQTLTTEIWDVEQRSGEVGGYTTFTVSGGHFPYRGRIDFTGTAFVVVIADRKLDCL